MCGIIASCICAKARDNSAIHGHVIGQTSDQLNGYTNGSVKSNCNGHGNGYPSPQINGRDNNGLSDVETRKHLAKQLQTGIDAIRHRGPDGSGVWVSPDGHVGLGHCRLSINDLSHTGAQPLHSHDDRIHAVVNGEIYDHDRLRKVCATTFGYQFTGASDSELVLALYKIYGTPGLFQQLRGEFAFVLFDNREGSRRVIAGRDRYGIKPLLWTIVGEQVLFAAEAKAFLPLGWKPQWNVRGITDSGWMMDDRTVFKGVRKLMPGHWMEVTDAGGVEIHKYWDAEYPDKVELGPFVSTHEMNSHKCI